MKTTIPDIESEGNDPSDQDSSHWKARLVSRIVVSLVVVFVGWSYFTGKIHEQGVVLVIAGGVVAVLWMQLGFWMWAARPDLLRRLLVRFGRYPFTFWWFTSLPGLMIMSYFPESIEDYFFIISESDTDDMMDIDEILQNEEPKNQR